MKHSALFKSALSSAALSLAFASVALAADSPTCNSASVAGAKAVKVATDTKPAAKPKLTENSEKLKAASDKFTERYPKTKVKSYSLTPIPGIYEASVGKEVLYFDDSARYVFSGRLLDMDKGLDLTAERIKDIRRINFDQLPLDLAVKEVKGDGKRRIAVFTDVDCPFSRKLSQTLKEIDNVTIYTFLFPLTSIHPEAKAKSDAVWCAKDSVSLLDKALKGETIPVVQNNPMCDSPVQSILNLAAEHGIGGTPTIFNEAGDRTAGALPKDKLEAFIDAANSKKVPA